jgi:L-gulonate 3-dehydrogenase
MDLNAPAGFADYAARYGATYQTMGADLTVAAPWREEAASAVTASRRAVLPEGRIAEAMRSRDRMLMRLLALRKAEGRDR